VGGAVGTGAHGSSLRYTASLSDQTIELLIVDGLGNIRRIDSEEDLKSFRVHLGLLGIVLQLKFRTIPLFKFRAHNYVVNEDILDERAMQIARVTDQVIFHWFPSFKKVLLANWTRMDMNEVGNAHTNSLIPPTTASFNFFGKRILEGAQALNSLQLMNVLQYISFLALFKTVPDVMPIYTENNIHVENPAVGLYNRMSSVSCVDSGV
jgi:FAD/FMN-containing dehydrogenase